MKNSNEVKQTNEISMTIPLLEEIDIRGKDITADALLTQQKIAKYLVEDRDSHYHFTVKGNQPTMLKDIEFYFQQRSEPDYVDVSFCDHGRIETRKIWTTSELNDYLNFPYVKQAFIIERHTVNKKSGKKTCEIAYGITSRTYDQADAKCLLSINRGHWSIENSCHYIIDWNYNEDRNRISKGYGPENITRLRRFAVGIIKSKGVYSVSQKMRELTMNVRLVFDYLKMTYNSNFPVVN